MQDENQQLEEALKYAEKEAKELMALKTSLENQLENVQVRKRSIRNI